MSSNPLLPGVRMYLRSSKTELGKITAFEKWEFQYTQT